MVSWGRGHPKARLSCSLPSCSLPSCSLTCLACCQGPSFLCGRASLQGYLSVLTTWHVVPESRASPGVSDDTVSEVARCHFCHLCFTLVTRSQALSPAHTQGEENWALALEGKHTFLEGKKLCGAYFKTNIPSNKNC